MEDSVRAILTVRPQLLAILEQQLVWVHVEQVKLLPSHIYLS